MTNFILSVILAAFLWGYPLLKQPWRNAVIWTILLLLMAAQFLSSGTITISWGTQ